MSTPYLQSGYLKVVLPRRLEKPLSHPTARNCWILWCTQESCSAPKGLAQLESCPIRYEPLSIIRVLKRKGCSSSPVEFIHALRFVQVCLTAKNASNSRSIFSPRALLSALSSFMSSLSSSMRWLSLASLALVSSQFTASSVATTPHAPGCAHSTRADGKDVNKESRLLFLEVSTQLEN